MYNKSKKIAFCISSFRAGGGEKQMIEIANALAANGHAIDLLVLKPVGQLKEKVDMRINVISLDAGRILFSLPKLASYLYREKPSVMLSVDEYTHVLALVARSLVRAKTRIVLRIGNMLSILAERYEGKAKILPYLSNWLFKRANHIIANSRGVADDVVRVTGIEPSRVTVIMNPKSREEILVKAQEPVTHEWFLNKTVPIVIAVGRLRVQKNFKLLIRAFAKLPHTVHARLVIVGSGREGERLRKVAEKAGITDRVYFTDYVDNPYAWMKKADVYVATSLWEGLPNALLEAMVCGLPAIAADCSSGPREILAPNTDYRKRLAIVDAVEYAEFGALYAVDDETALTDAMARFLTDSALRQKYASASIERSKDFDSHDIVGEYAHVLGI